MRKGSALENNPASGWRRAKENLFREPRHGVSDRVGFLSATGAVLFGLGFAAYGCFFAYDGPYWHGMPQITMGFFLAAAFGAPEFLPRRWNAAAGWLRIAAFISAIALVAAQWAF